MGEKKVNSFLGKDPKNELPLTLAASFAKIAKFGSDVRNHDLSIDWGDRMNDRMAASAMKHPYQVFLYQNVYGPLTYKTTEDVKKLKFPGAETQKDT